MIYKKSVKIFKHLENEGLAKTFIKVITHLVYITKNQKHLKEIKKYKIEYNLDININDYKLTELKKKFQTIGSENKIKQIAVYSTYFGNNDNKTLDNKRVTSNIPHYFISNNKQVLRKSEELGWKPLFFELKISDNKILSSLQSKIPKALPHLFNELKIYKTLIYRDDKLFLSDKALDEILLNFNKNNYIIAARLHTSQPRNIINEFGESMRQLRYSTQLESMSQYILNKLNSGFSLEPEKFFLTGLIIRDMQNSDVEIFNEYWYNEIIKCGIECQISFNFCTQEYPFVETIDEYSVHKI